MKRIIQPILRTLSWCSSIFCVVLLLLFLSAGTAFAGISPAGSSGAPGSGRTLINGERLLFGFIFLPHQAVEGKDLSLEEDILILLRDHRDSLRMVAPEGMVPVSGQPGVLLGYFAGDSSAVSFRVARIDLEAGSLPVRVDRSQLVQTTGGRRLHLSPWDIPAWPEAIFPDGLDDDWEDISPIRSFSSIFLPPQVELRSGRALSFQEGADREDAGQERDDQEGIDQARILAGSDDIASARFWRLGGTMVRHVYSHVGRDSWFLALRTEEQILDNTGYHFRLSPEAELVVLVDGRSGPVVYRRRGESPRWAGQYALNNRFLEIQLDRDLLGQALEQATRGETEPLREISLITSHRTPSRVERFYLAELPLPRGLRQP